MLIALVAILNLDVLVGYTQSGTLAPEGVFGETYLAPFPVDIALDGEFDDWQRVPQVYMDGGIGSSAISFAAASDGEFLYLYADIIDDTIISGEHGGNYWNEDSVEFYINATGDLSLVGYADGVAQITIPALNRNLSPEEVVLAGVNGSTTNAQVHASETDSGWAVELAMPLANGDIWTINPEQGAEIGFQVHLNSASELNRDSKLIWSVFDTSDVSYQNPSVFGRLIFHEVSSEPVFTGDYVFTSALSDDGTLDDFENGIWLDEFDGDVVGLEPTGEAYIAIQQLINGSSLALPDQAVIADNVLAVLGSGGFQHHFTDSVSAITLDWSAYNAIGMWVFGQNSDDVITVNVDATATTLVDDFNGWQFVTIPFALFEGDFDPASVGAYGVSFPNDGYVNDVRLFSVENTDTVIIGDGVPRYSFITDETVSWESREWELMWSDEFDGEANSPIDSDSWTCEIGGHGWGNNELEYYTDSLDNVSMNGDGQLVITAMQGQPESGEACWYGQCAYTSARCITRDKVEFTYGRVEARLNIPIGQGVWPAFWMLGANFDEVGWPDSGEIDIMENVGNDPLTVHGTIHGPGYSGSGGIGNSLISATNFADDFHVYAIDWDPNIIRWYVDGELFGTVSANDLRNREWVFDHDFFLLLNVAVGGSWPGFPDDSTEFPQEMLVDYVRVYQLAVD